MIIDDINFNDLYLNHLKASKHYSLPADKWDKKARNMAQNMIGKISKYNDALLAAIHLQPDETLLDIGCGPGTLAIPLCRQGKAVYALDYSRGMLEVLQEYKEQLHLDNLHLLHKSWHDSWEDVPQADVLLASRSTLVDDLDDMIDKLCAKAKKRVYLTSVTQRHFLDEGILQAIGRQNVGFPSYIYLLNRLYQRGIQANLNFIETESGVFQGKTYEDLLTSVEFSLGALNDGEKTALANFYQQRQQSGQPIYHGQRKWALIWWEI